jgi:hypothetical protein
MSDRYPVVECTGYSCDEMSPAEGYLLIYILVFLKRGIVG